MDESDREGAVARNLFRTDSDSENEEVLPQDACSQADGHLEESSFVRRKILHVVVEEQQTGGSIAHRLWPAAEYLAEFVLELTRSPEVPPNLETVARGLAATDRSAFIPIIELGAGIGVTGLELATQLNAKVLLTDLDEALRLLRRNVELNRDCFSLGEDAVNVMRMDWSILQDSKSAIDWYHDTLSLCPTRPLLILGSDCVYWESLHDPLERTLQLILSCSPNSVCLLAGMRRWKRDNSFYQNLGKRTRTTSHELQCTCLKERVRRVDGQREVMRIYEVRWCERSCDKSG